MQNKMISFLNIIVVFVLVLANGFFVASEFALVGVRRSRIAILADSGDPRAKLLLQLLDNLNAYISATQLGITMASLALGWIGEPVFARLLEAPLQGLVSDTVRHAIAFAVAFTVITFLHIVLGELAPKTLALERAEKTALAIALPMQWFYKVFRWPIRLLDWAGTRTVRLFGLRPSTDHGSIYTAEELRQLVDASHKSGHLEADERKLIHRVFEFSDAGVRQAMVPRLAVEALPVTATLEEAKNAFRSSGYSRMPVYRRNLDDIVGVLFRRDLEPYLEEPGRNEFKLESLIHYPVFIPATVQLGVALKQMQSSRTHLTIVVDEHGGMEGIVTLEDLLEEIVGEISDEYDEEARSQIVEEHGTYVLDGMLTVRDANRRFDLRLAENVAYTTIAGFLLAQAGRLLHEGESVEYAGARFTVERLQGHRIRRIRFTPGGAGKRESLSVLLLLAGTPLKDASALLFEHALEVLPCIS
jgi:CBS domain containing-hemolysin-like protein